MKTVNSYQYVGPKEIIQRVEKQFEGIVISSVKDVMDWIQSTKQTISCGEVIATFIIDLNHNLVIADRHSEHVMCAGGKNVLSAGEITFNVESDPLYVNKITNQSTGYCPEPGSWVDVSIALGKTDLIYPVFFTTDFEFRYCEHCQNKNLVKENIFECIICGKELDPAWNIYKMYR